MLSSDETDYAVAANEAGEIITLSDVEAMYRNPDMFIDSLLRSTRTVWTLDENCQPGRIVTGVPPGLVQLFSEILANACDAITKTLRKKFKPGPIEVTYQNPYITIRNEGFPILVRQGTDGVWNPERIVTQPRTGSNLTGHRHGGGKNGYGMTVVLAFTDYLRLVIYDSVNKKHYEQEFYGPYDVRKPVVEEYDGEISSVEVTFKPTFSRFHYPEGCEAYPDEIEHYYRAHAAVASLACKTPVYYNDMLMDYSNIFDYANIFFDPLLKKKVHYVWPRGTRVIHREDGSQVAEDGLTLPDIELIVIDSDRETDKSHIRQFGIANSVLNQDGGIHVNAVFEQLGPALIAHINGKKEKNSEENKGFFRVNMTHIKAALNVIISVRVVNPFFEGQSKNTLKSHTDMKKKEEINTLKLKIPPSLIEEIIDEFDCIKALQETVNASLLKPLQDLNGKKTLNCGKLHYGEDANWAGGKNSHKCILFIFEGKSAGAYAKEFRSLCPNGIDCIGLLPTGGKIKNLFGINPDTVSKLARNLFFQDFKTMLNIRETGVDYRLPEDRNQLRYGTILYAGDADIDGIHICSLFINMMNVLYQSALQAGIVSTYRTKILSAVSKRGKKKMVFYELWQYEEWAKTVNITKYNVKYFKGLGSSTKQDAKEDYEAMFVVACEYDEYADDYIHLFFDQTKEMAAERRERIMAYDPEDVPPPIGIDEEGNRYEAISSYLAHSYISYCAHTPVRHLSARDGLTEVRRKIIYAAILRWNYWKADNVDKPVRVSVFDGTAKEKTNYHHGDSFSGVITRMAQDFVGSNNIPYFIGDGQFGTRDEGGGDAASARYISILPNVWWLKLIFDPRDDRLLTHNFDEGDKVEPQFYLPCLPMTLVMGQDSVMSGFRSYIPPYHVLDLCDWYLARLSGKLPKEIEEFIPFFRHFRGAVEIVDKRKEKETVETILDDDGQVVVDGDGEPEKEYTTTVEGKYSVRTWGIVEDIEGDCLTVAELPVGVWTKTFYEKTLPRLKEEGKIKNFRKIAPYSEERPRIRVEGIRPRDGSKRAKITTKDFPLVKSYPLGLMLILGEDKKPMHFDSVVDILEDYYQFRLPWFEKRRQLELDEADKIMKDSNDKVAYVEAVINKKLEIRNRKKEDILSTIRDLDLREDLYGFTKHYDKETVAALRKQAQQARATYEELSNTTAESMMMDAILNVQEGYLNAYGDDRR